MEEGIGTANPERTTSETGNPRPIEKDGGEDELEGSLEGLEGAGDDIATIDFIMRWAMRNYPELKTRREEIRRLRDAVGET